MSMMMSHVGYLAVSVQSWIGVHTTSVSRIIWGLEYGGPLATILKLPIIFERVPVKKVDAAGETQVKRAAAREP